MKSVFFSRGVGHEAGGGRGSERQRQRGLYVSHRPIKAAVSVPPYRKVSSWYHRPTQNNNSMCSGLRKEIHMSSENHTHTHSLSLQVKYAIHTAEGIPYSYQLKDGLYNSNPQACTSIGTNTRCAFDN